MIVVNPVGGWHELVHLLSHYLSPGKHGADHARCELRLIKEVIRRGWLEGKLRSPEKVVVPVPIDEVRSKRKARLQERLKKWESRKKRAETAIRKLRKSIRYYERLEAHVEEEYGYLVDRKRGELADEVAGEEEEPEEE